MTRYQPGDFEGARGPRRSDRGHFGGPGPPCGEVAAVSEELELPALPTAVSCVRRFVEARLRKWRLDDLIETVDLVASELLTNAVKATGLTELPAGGTTGDDPDLARVVTRLRLSRSSVFVDIWDADPSPPVPASASALDEGGRGLVLVAAMTAAWGHYSSDAGGKVVWAEVAVR